MKTVSVKFIQLALTLLFCGVLATPTLFASVEQPRGTWMAEWLRPQVVERSMGVLTLRDNKLSFADQANVGWEIELASVKRVAQTNDGRALLIVTSSGDEYVAAIMDPSMARISPKKAVSTIERAVQLLAANR